MAITHVNMQGSTNVCGLGHKYYRWWPHHLKNNRFNCKLRAAHCVAQYLIRFNFKLIGGVSKSPPLPLTAEDLSVDGLTFRQTTNWQISFLVIWHFISVGIFVMWRNCLLHFCFYFAFYLLIILFHDFHCKLYNLLLFTHWFMQVATARIIILFILFIYLFLYSFSYVLFKWHFTMRNMNLKVRWEIEIEKSGICCVSAKHLSW